MYVVSTEQILNRTGVLWKAQWGKSLHPQWRLVITFLCAASWLALCRFQFLSSRSNTKSVYLFELVVLKVVCYGSFSPSTSKARLARDNSSCISISSFTLAYFFRSFRIKKTISSVCSFPLFFDILSAFFVLWRLLNSNNSESTHHFCHIFKNNTFHELYWLRKWIFCIPERIREVVTNLFTQSRT